MTVQKWAQKTKKRLCRKSVRATDGIQRKKQLIKPKYSVFFFIDINKYK